MAPTTLTCSPPPAWASPSTPRPRPGRRPTPRSAFRTLTRFSTSSDHPRGDRVSGRPRGAGDPRSPAPLDPMPRHPWLRLLDASPPVAATSRCLATRGCDTRKIATTHARIGGMRSRSTDARAWRAPLVRLGPGHRELGEGDSRPPSATRPPTGLGSPGPRWNSSGTSRSRAGTPRPEAARIDQVQESGVVADQHGRPDVLGEAGDHVPQGLSTRLVDTWLIDHATRSPPRHRSPFEPGPMSIVLDRPSTPAPAQPDRAAKARSCESTEPIKGAPCSPRVQRSVVIGHPRRVVALACRTSTSLCKAADSSCNITLPASALRRRHG